MHKGIFITGTDTGVGKTYAASGLLNALKKMGINACPMKPVETGCDIQKGKLIPQDAITLINASGASEPLDVINPYRFRHPIAPSVAAEMENIRIKKQEISSAYNYLLNKYDITVVEGAGGIMTPVYKKYLFLDLIKDLRLPVVIVSRPALGTINHTLLTIEAAKSRGINIHGIIINHAGRIKKGTAERTNPEIIEYLGRVPILGVVPYSKNPVSPLTEKIFSRIAGKILSCL
ncbi:MAG: dethiobiotin synthase [Nitrospirae bacterium]|nr:dethiobiotin synthase [Nitrospirota bacterium]